LLLNRKAFLAFHKTHTYAYQIRQIPFFTFLLLEQETHIANAVAISGGIIKHKPNNLFTSFHILAAPLQWRKR
jgi:hypothetical protein